MSAHGCYELVSGLTTFVGVHVTICPRTSLRAQLESLALPEKAAEKNRQIHHV